MEIGRTAFFTILGMALVTYLSRIGGLWCLNRMAITPRLEAWLKVLPGTILVSIVAPSIIMGGPAEKLSALLTILVAWRTRNILLAMMIGVAAVWSLRYLLGG
ncbi:MAG: AzlD domain-containing protein [Deltaproteobacteria bacterium]|nr:AzlD domain-containing protein [Deltaproteobacteria bacterium]